MGFSIHFMLRSVFLRAAQEDRLRFSLNFPEEIKGYHDEYDKDDGCDDGKVAACPDRRCFSAALPGLRRAREADGAYDLHRLSSASGSCSGAALHEVRAGAI